MRISNTADKKSHLSFQCCRVWCLCPWGSWTFKMSPTTYDVETFKSFAFNFTFYCLYDIDMGRKWATLGLRPVIPRRHFIRGAKFSYGIRFRSLLWLSFFSRFWPPRFKVLFFISSFFFYSSSSTVSSRLSGRGMHHSAFSSFSPPPSQLWNACFFFSYSPEFGSILCLVQHISTSQNKLQWYNKIKCDAVWSQKWWNVFF